MNEANLIELMQREISLLRTANEELRDAHKYLLAGNTYESNAMYECYLESMDLADAVKDLINA